MWIWHCRVWECGRGIWGRVNSGGWGNGMDGDMGVLGL